MHTKQTCQKIADQKRKHACTHDIKVGYSCNNNCIHCVAADNRKQLRLKALPINLTTKECLALINFAARNGAEKVVLTGGEPTIRKDFLQLLHYCDKCDLFVEVQTNGRMLKDEGICRHFPKPDKTVFCIPIHGPNAKIHDKITRRLGSFDETLLAVQNLRKNDCSVTGKVVISKLNYLHLSEILHLIHRIGVQNCNIAFPHALGNARIHFTKVVPRYSKIQQELNKMLEEASRLLMPVSLEAVPFCIIPERPEVVSELKYLSSDSLSFFTPVRESCMNWDYVRRKIKQKLPQCKNCCYFLICEGPWEEYVERFGAEEFEPVTFNPMSFKRLMRQIELIQKR